MDRRKLTLTGHYYNIKLYFIINNFSTGLPPQIATRLHHLSLIALKFAVNLLCWDRTEQFPGILSREIFNEITETYQTILFNDETHTYDGVIRALELGSFF